MRFSQFTKGISNVKVVDLPRISTDGSEQTLRVGLRPMAPSEDDLVDSLASAYAKKLGVAEYTDTHPICVKARMQYTLALVCLDADSDPGNPVPFFVDEPHSRDSDSVERRAEIIRTGIVNTPDGPVNCGMTPDMVIYLHECWQVHNDQISPQALTIKDADLAEMCRKAASSEDFWLRLAPGARVSCLRFMGALLLASLEVSCGPSSASTTDTAKNASASAKGKAPRKSASKSKRKAIRKARRP